jgi:tripartite-type tricarboxylate transporter receptor subunit TctC
MAQSNATMVEPTDDARAIYLMDHPDSVEEIPIIDVGPYLDVPAERVAALRQAFMAMFKDPDFLAESAKQDYDVSPISGEDMTALIGELANTPRSVIDEVSALVAPQAPK